MLSLYNAALTPLRPAVALWSLWRTLMRPESAAEWRERRARLLPVVPPGGVWIHGASAGEARIVTALAREMRSRRPELPLAASTYTPAGRAALPGPPRIDAAFFLPLDFRDYVRRVLGAVRPSRLALVETELWPNLLAESHRAGIPVVVLNGRLSAERMSRYRRLRRLLKPLLEKIVAVGAQTDRDAERFRTLGVRAEAIEVLGNIKYDLPRPDVDPAALRRRLKVAEDRPVLVAGSTGIGEEELILQAFDEIRREHDNLYLVLAPRHTPRATEVERLVLSRGLRCRRWTDESGARGEQVLLVDTIGELSRLYGIADAAFVGGSLVPVGGHNLLEPAVLGLPVLFGPHTGHVAEPAAALEAAGGGRRVATAAELAQTVVALLRDPARRAEMGRRALRLVENSRGALARSTGMLMETRPKRGIQGPGAR